MTIIWTIPEIRNARIYRHNELKLSAINVYFILVAEYKWLNLIRNTEYFTRQRRGRASELFTSDALRIIDRYPF